MHYTAPVWISEFGSGGRNDFVLADRSWWANFVQVLIDRDLDFAYWPLVGWQANRTGDGWALMSWDPSGNRMGLFDGDDWRQPAWSSLIAAPASVNGTVEPVAVWRMLSIDSGDAQQSERMAKEGDWSVGNRKASCPDGLRLIGLSYGNNPRALCTDSTVGRGVWDPTNGTFEVVTDEKYVDEKKGDWAKGFMKLQCPPDHFLIGHSFSSSQSNGGLCAAATTDLGLVQESSRTVWFDQSDNMPTSHGEWAPNMTKGACGDTEFAVGYAFKSGKKQKGYPSALLCRTSQAYETAGRISQTGDAGSKCFQFAADGLVLVVFLVVSSAFALSLY